MQGKTRFAILGILMHQPASGYDIKRYCDGGIAGFWHENYGHLYPMLQQMAADGDITVTDTARSGRKRRLYQITDHGKVALLDWLEQPIEPSPVRLELLLKLSFARYGDTGRMTEMISDIRRKHAGRLDELLRQEKKLLADQGDRKEPGFPYWHSIVRYGIMDAEFRLHWCDETIERIRQHATELTQPDHLPAGSEAKDEPIII